MTKQHHYVVVFDEKTNRFSIEWDTTQLMLEESNGTVFDTEEQAWQSGFGDDYYNVLSDRLAKILDEANSQV
jgi:hypothetical protein